MRLRVPLMPCLAVGCLGALVVACEGRALLHGEQFAFRDASDYYYPLYERVQQEWNGGRWPLWEPEQNGGMPLLGNPAAAVLYPGKLLYAVLPYPWAARAYIVLHSVLAFAAMAALLRWWGVSAAGSAIGGLAYAFGGHVLFQYCNVIYLVGAAWLPLGLRAVDRWVRAGRRWAVPELAAVLVLQCLGGDPETAYLLCVSAAAYLAGLALRGQRLAAWMSWRVIGGVGLAWVAGALVAAWWSPRWAGGTTALADGASWLVPLGWLAAWVIGFAGLAAALWRTERGRGLRRGLLGLVGAAGLAILIGAAQLLPVAEWARGSSRVQDHAHFDLYRYSVEPYRVAELLWPWVFGQMSPENHCWLFAIPPASDHSAWTPSVYMGSLVLVLALIAAQRGGREPWRGWLVGLAAVSLLASFGRLGSPLWLARGLPGAEVLLGPRDPAPGSAVRADGFLPDAFGSLYAVMAAVLPGFDAFQFPAKLFTFTALSMAALTGAGWDDLVAGRSRGFGRLSAILLGVTMVLGALTVGFREPLLTALRHARSSTHFGPLSPEHALGDTQAALLHGGVVVLVGMVLWRLSRVRPRLASALALVCVTVDLALAHRSLVLTVPQQVFDMRPAAADRILSANRDEGDPGPFRIFRSPHWQPEAWYQRPSPRRVQQMVAWGRDTLELNNGANLGISTTVTPGALTLADLEAFFRPFTVPAGPRAAAVGLTPGQPITYFPRRAADLWGSRYLIVPMDSQNGVAAALRDGTERVFPTPGEPPSLRAEARWRAESDWQVLRNTAAYPRAWVVHQVRVVPPVKDVNSAAARSLMAEILYADDSLWNEPGRPVHDPRAVAWLETDRPGRWTALTGSVAPDAADRVRITEYEPQRVVLSASTQRPGIVVLADIYDVGWRLRVDGQAAEVLRVNRAMRGAFVTAGQHELVFTYEPVSFRVGLAASGVGLVLLALVCAWARRPALEPA